MLKLPDFNALRIANGYGPTQLNRRNSCYLLHQWSMYRSPICRAGHFGGEYSGKGAYNRKRTGRNSNGIGGQQEHYTVLGLAKGATSADIKKAFRTLARQYHPDVNKDPDADDSFKSIRLAYEVLSNETTRYQYDMALRLQESGINGQWRESELNGGRRYSWAGK
ncbi:hypothetical protein SUGI_0444800 [Cryptomeria japonica]|uniref:uncharacterized protein LOC131076690 isoform X2 n=1 Tax=Cryptomeria japonica TaxID=3369 RepID=UPI002408B9F1|nr:uncharacterized protein LOC131076690 isoform X2 [Cryptomeria japonica]GLJ23480.1 hypothetical protein SUGI_0444800 [Cryptomeria japonica]